MSSAEALFVNCNLASTVLDLICNKEAGLLVPIPTLPFPLTTKKFVEPAVFATFKAYSVEADPACINIPFASVAVLSFTNFPAYPATSVST